MNGTLTHYHIICNTDIGLGRFSIRIIPCSCVELSYAIDLPCNPYLLPKDYPWFSSVTEFTCYLVIGKHNDWEILYLINKGTYEEEYKP